jgi:hypothetical protein
MVHPASARTAIFTTWSHRYIQTRLISHDMDNCILSSLLNTIKPRAYGRNDSTTGRDGAAKLNRSAESSKRIHQMKRNTLINK